VELAAARRIAITMITTNNAASAPAKEAGSTSGVESRPFMNAPSIVGIGFRYVCA